MTDAFYPEITEDDIEVIEGDGGPSYRYVFPVRELSDGVSLHMAARWDPVGDGYQPSVIWGLAGDESSPSDFAFVGSLPKSFAETVDDITFDPPPDEVINPDAVTVQVVDTRQPVVIKAVSHDPVATLDAGDPLEMLTAMAQRLNDIRVQAEVTACSKYANTPMVLQVCVLDVTAKHPDAFGGNPCGTLTDELNATLYASDAWASFTAACENVVDTVKTGAAAKCPSTLSPDEFNACQETMLLWLVTRCNSSARGIDLQICAYDAVVAVGDEWRCDILASADMAWDCHAAVSKWPGWCAKIDDPAHAASCCENFKGTDQYDACLASIPGDEAAGESAPTTPDSSTETTGSAESVTAAPKAEESPPIGGDLQSIDDPGFFAEYHCTTESGPARVEALAGANPEWSIRYTREDGHFMWETAQAGGPHPLSLPDAPFSITPYLNSPGPWIPLDQTTYTLINGRSGDRDSSSSKTDMVTYSDLTFAQDGSGTLTQGGWDWSVVKYTGGYTLDTDEENRVPGFEYRNQESTKHSMTAWYHEGTGLLVGSEDIAERTAYFSNVEGFEDRRLGVTGTDSCELTDTNLDLSG